MSCKGPKICAGDLKNSITIERRSLDTPAPGSALPGHTYTTILTTRAKIKTKTGVSEWNQVSVGDKKSSHTITMKFTTLEFDTRDRVKDGSGNLYEILAVENIDERDNWLNLHCSRKGNETRKAAT